MESSIELGGKEYKLQSSLFTIIEYKKVFGTELFSDVKNLDTNKSNEDNVSEILDTIFRITYILNRPFTNSSYNDFLKTVDFKVLNEPKALERLSDAIGQLLGKINKGTSIPHQ